MGQRNTFPLKLCALLLVKLTKMVLQGKQTKLLPHPKSSSSLYFRCPVETHITVEISRLPSRGGIQASGRFKVQ